MMRRSRSGNSPWRPATGKRRLRVSLGTPVADSSPLADAPTGQGQYDGRSKYETTSPARACQTGPSFVVVAPSSPPRSSRLRTAGITVSFSRQAIANACAGFSTASGKPTS